MVRAIRRGGGPRGGDSEADLFDLRQARRMARAALKAGRPTSALVLWTLAPEWTSVYVRGHSYRGSANWVPTNAVAGEVNNGVIIV